jgi:hypothetical protein
MERRRMRRNENRMPGAHAAGTPTVLRTSIPSTMAIISALILANAGSECNAIEAQASNVTANRPAII